MPGCASKALNCIIIPRPFASWVNKIPTAQLHAALLSDSPPAAAISLNICCLHSRNLPIRGKAGILICDAFRKGGTASVVEFLVGITLEFNCSDVGETGLSRVRLASDNGPMKCLRAQAGSGVGSTEHADIRLLPFICASGEDTPESTSTCCT